MTQRSQVQNIDPLAVVNTTTDPISEAIKSVKPQGQQLNSIVPSSGSFTPISSETTNLHSADEYEQQKSKLEALQASGKDPSKYDINGAPLGLYGGQVSAQDFTSSIAKPRTVINSTYAPDDYISMLKEGQLGSTEYDGNTVINYQSTPEGGFASFISPDNSDLGFSINRTDLTKEQAKSIFNNYAKEAGGQLQIENYLGTGDIGGQGDLVQRKDGSWTFKFDKPSNLSIAGDVLTTVAIAASTGGIGASLGTALGVGTSVGTGLAAGGLTAARGGSAEDALLAGVTAGLGDWAKTTNQAVKAAQAAGASAEAMKGLQATADLANQFNSVVKLGQAIDSKNPLKALDAGLGVAGIPSMQNIATEKLLAGAEAGSFLAENAGAFSGAALEVAEGLAQGKDKITALADGIGKYIKDGGSLEGLLPDGGSLDFDVEIPEWANTLADKASEINKEYIKPALDEVDQLVRELPTTKKDWEDANAKIDETIRDLPTTKEDWQDAEDTIKQAGRDFDDNVLQPTKNFLLDNAGSVLGVAGALLGGGGSAGGTGGGQPFEFSNDLANNELLQYNDPMVEGLSYDEPTEKVNRLIARG